MVATRNPQTDSKDRSQKPLWEPSKERVQKANFTAYLKYLQQHYHLTFNDYSALHQWSVQNPQDFWFSIAQFFQIKFYKPLANIRQLGKQFYQTQWFPGSTLNYAEHLLRHKGSDIALITYAERHPRKMLSFEELREQVAACQAGLIKAGIKPGDPVAGLLPNCSEAVIAMLATTALGAIWSSCSPDFGLQGVLDRFNQINPKVLFATNGYLYNGKEMNTVKRVENIQDQLSKKPKLVWVDFFDPNQPFSPTTDYGLTWNDFIGKHNKGSKKETQGIHFEPIAFNAPLFILYSSGTTGKPKCIVHSVGGTLIQHLKELGLHTDLKPKDRLFYFTTCGWMMWNWLISGLALGATLILYDGSPMAPKPKVLWKIAEDEGITHFGASAKYYASLNKFNYFPKDHFQLPSLRTLLSTGSPLAPETFKFLYDNVKQDLCIASISGGTDIISCFALGNPTLPVYAGELQCKGLGMDVDIINDEGHSLHQIKGELVCRSPFPSMPIGFWQDPENKQYQAAYFERFQGIWSQGDYGEITSHQGLIIYGRSDAVLNPGGIRIGTAEIYQQVESFNEIFETVAVGQKWKEDERIILFVVMQPKKELTDALKTAIKNRIKENATPRHVPEKIIEVPEIPKTLSGKIVELAIRSVIHGEQVKNIEALVNPNALEHYKGLQTLQS